MLEDAIEESLVRSEACCSIAKAAVCREIRGGCFEQEGLQSLVGRDGSILNGLIAGVQVVVTYLRN